MTHQSFAVGAGLGLLVAAQLGPISLLLIRTVMRGALLSGLAIGAGAAVVDTLYACLGVAGAAPLVQLDAVRIAMGTAGACLLVLLGARTLWSALRVRLGGESADEVAGPRRAFATSLAATASNPFTILSWAAIFAAASTADAASTTAGTVALVAGIGLGSFAWFTMLATGVAFARRRIGDRLLRLLDSVAGAGLVVFGGVLGLRTLRGE
jgi:putative LysE/RhtB family amino acid efflux pump